MLEWTVDPRLHTWHPVGSCQKPNHANESFSYSHTMLFSFPCMLHHRWVAVSC